MTQRDPMAQLTQLTQVKFNDPMTQHGPMAQRDTCAIRFSQLRNNEPRARARRRVYFPFWALLPPRAGTCWLDSAACVNFVTHARKAECRSDGTLNTRAPCRGGVQSRPRASAEQRCNGTSLARLLNNARLSC